ncbi:hypothetical protein F2Q69_00046971 [Brassica cretica]|uniref:Ubiquitin-like protease family profile domain-containing protein n=1 Tax=Brassica cretica TaxID=69181 RepID=A0A8S9PH92_BRACR|nr:hypothetical protein F2Q69_00046971 [Brassica cretica]
MVKTVGFPLALQLVTFRCIPQLAAFVGGDDTAAIMQYPEKSMPLHAGLNLAHVRKAEHDPALKVDPMMKISGDHEDRWGFWDDENYDKKAEYMVQLLKEGHLFVKPNWLGGDAGDPLFVYIEKLKTPKRKKQVVSEDEPLPKQRRISGFFRRTQTGVDPGKFAALEGRGRSQKKYRRSCRKKTNVDVTESQMGADVNLDNRNNDDVVTSSEETESGGVDVFGTLAQQPGGLHRGNEAIAEKVEEKMSSEGISAAVRAGKFGSFSWAVMCDAGMATVPDLPEVGGGLLPTSEGKARAVDEDVTGASRPERTNLEEVFEGVATHTGEVEEVSEVRPEITEGEEKPLGEDRVIEEVGGNDAKSNVASGAVVVVAGKPEAESSVAHARAEVGVYKKNEQEKMGVSKENQKHVVVDQVGIDDEIGSGDDLTDDDAADAKEDSGSMVLSDSPTPLAARHVPLADEEELAAFLLAKSPLTLADMHMEVLMKYNERRYGLGVHLDGGMFVAPWFTVHMQRKGRSFKAARRKTVIAGDAKITKYLTRSRQRWGAEVDRLYTPMIWEGSNWVEQLLDPVSTMVPYIAKKVCPAVGERAQVSFRVVRMHATGDRNPTMAGLTDDLVDIFQKHYAMDIYKGVVVPCICVRVVC